MWRNELLGSLLSAPAQDFICNLHLSRQDLWQTARLIRSLLTAKLGLQPTHRIVVLAAKHWVVIAIYLACIEAGWILAPISPGTKEARLQQIVLDLQPSVIIRFETETETTCCETETPSLGCPLLLCAVSCQDAKSVQAAFAASLEKSAVSPIQFLTDPSASECSLLLYTSGTTGFPKAAMVTYKMIVVNLSDLIRLWQITPTDTVLHTLPLYHVHGLLLAVFLPLMGGGKVYWQSMFDKAQVAEAWSEATIFMSVPEVYKCLLRVSLPPPSACQMRLCLCGSGPVSADVVQRFRALFGYRLVVRYGMSECGMITSNDLDEEAVEGDSVSVGRALEDRRLRIAQEETASPVDEETASPINEETASPVDEETASPAFAEVQVKSSSIFMGYWRDAAKTKAAFTCDGYFKTGDLGSIVNGRLFLAGRIDDMFVIGGENVYPVQIEQQVLRGLAIEQGWSDYCCSKILVGGDETCVAGVLDSSLCCLFVPEQEKVPVEQANDHIWDIDHHIWDNDSSGVVRSAVCETRWIGQLRACWETRLVPKVFVPCRALLRNHMGKLNRRAMLAALTARPFSVLRTHCPDEKKRHS
eukprot:Gregarina_sp_Pseudo_9__1534@NODE_202_length_3625_cov_22_671779_g187_i0_p1_GENE_NODE_202_length_3625_cov_22_671779_g187_i0NODE_202_length_3625_cov_22_671779_g187_i0_p1_ORF_typecomplete_len586_score154_07AMPbinding/PF00501_28/2e77_NODE_202_length_3625_cov_22_671779_g187_i010212778